MSLLILLIPSLVLAAPSPPHKPWLSGRTSLFPRSSVLERTIATCPAGGSFSCHGSGSGSCCYESPGGLILQTQFWDTNPVVGPANSWGLHGLWPDNCDGTFTENCDSSRDYTNIGTLLSNAGQTTVLNYMNTFWQSNDESGEAFWEHEWSTHGTCYSTLNPSCYANYKTGDEAVDFFVRTVELFSTLQTYTWLAAAGITPGSSTYTLSALNAAVKSKFGQNPLFSCSGSTISAVEYFFNLQGSIPEGTFSAVAPVGSSNCPSSGITYPVKSGAKSTATPILRSSTPVGTVTTSKGSSTATKTTTASSGGGTGTSTIGSGVKGTINVSYNGGTTGCVISAGTWSVQTCATFTTGTGSSSGTLTLKSSKGLCQISGGELTCSSSVSTGTNFVIANGVISVSGSSSFSANAVPSGTDQETIFTGSGGSSSIGLSWVSS